MQGPTNENKPLEDVMQKPEDLHPITNEQDQLLQAEQVPTFDEQHDLKSTSDNHVPSLPLPRRSMRATTKRLVYDASTGNQVLPCSK